jgi:hypothetical protein
MVARGEGGGAAELSGAHPYALTAHLRLNASGPGGSERDGSLRTLRLELPPGLILSPSAPTNPSAIDRCTMAEFSFPRSSPYEVSQSGESCPDASQVGTVEVHTSAGGGADRRFGVFNLTPTAGSSQRLGLAPYGVPIIFDVQVQLGAEGKYAFVLETTDFSQEIDVFGLDLTLWGTPWAASHDGERGDCLNEAEPSFPWAKCSASSNEPLAYLTIPTDCSSPLVFTATASSWEQPGEVSAEYVTRDAGGDPLRLGDCRGLVFSPYGTGQLTDSKASSSSGFFFDLIDSDEGLTDPDGRVHSQVRKAVVTLPEGVTINPSLGSGLSVCTPGQYAAETPASFQGEGCPNESKIGNFTAKTPVFEAPLQGAIYLAQPDDRASPVPGAENPFDSLLAVYLVARSSPSAILIKVAGELRADPGTGQLTATFDHLPQLPYTRLEVHFRQGQRAPLVTPPFCGPATTRVELTPWAAAAPAVSTTNASPIETGIGRGPCPTGAAPRFTPTATAGSVNSNVGSYTPFYLRLTRTDAEQEITSYSAVLPKGVTGRLAGIPFCSDAAIAVARGRTGAEETLRPSCPAASQIGRTYSGYGLGPALAYAPGRIYLAGPYRGSPLSIVTINSATVGPFDLGTIVIRSAFQVDPATAQLRIDARASDPIPHIIQGIPLHLRDIRLYMDRPEFTRNPTSCEPSQVVSTLTGSGARFGDPADDSTAVVANHFQLLNCRNLAFRPRLGIRLRGGSRRGDYPALRATFAARPGDANLKRIAVTMPHSLFLAQNHIRGVCTQVQFAADSCPRASAYGHAVAYTPLFDEPLRGPVFLRSSNHRLPDLVASLHSGAVNIVLEGRISPARGGIRTFFTGLPDAQISRFTMQLDGGKRGLLVNSANICAAPPTATVKALAQNNVGAIFTTKLRGQCQRQKKGKKR